MGKERQVENTKKIVNVLGIIKNLLISKVRVYFHYSTKFNLTTIISI